MTKKVSVYLTEIAWEKLDYLSRNGYGNKSEIINSCGVTGTICDLYHMAKSEEDRIKRGL